MYRPRSNFGGHSREREGRSGASYKEKSQRIEEITSNRYTKDQPRKESNFDKVVPAAIQADVSPPAKSEQQP